MGLVHFPPPVPLLKDLSASLRDAPSSTKEGVGEGGYGEAEGEVTATKT